MSSRSRTTSSKRAGERAEGNVIDAALTNLIEHERNLNNARKDMDPQLVKEFNTSVIEVQYRTNTQTYYR